MRLIALLCFLTTVAVLSSCKEPPAPDGENKGTFTVRPEDLMDVNPEEVWTRTRQCADQAERTVRHVKEELATRTGGADSVVHWRNHYSPRYGRCFVAFYYSHSEAPRNSWAMYDAFENRMVASTIEDNSKGNGRCFVEDASGAAWNPSATCTRSWDFIWERMAY